MGRRLLHLVAIATLLSVACQAPATSRSRPTPSAAPSAGPSLSAADRKFFGGDYEGAETDYLALIKSESSGAAAHYTLLLTYEGRFQEAQAQAQAAVALRRDSSSLARLTRTLDWAEDVPAAVAAGAEAVAARPVDPIAHIFYAEALTDAGLYDAAQKELRAAESSADDAYSRAETAREWANYHRSRGNPDEELNYLEIAQRAQPHFPERTLELARHQYIAQKPEAARDLLNQIKQAQPNDYRVLMGAADAAFIGLDASTARSFYVAALQLRPDSGPAALGLAELDVAANRDFKAAHDGLLAALKKDPSQADVYYYLRYLDLLVLKIDPAAELNPIAPQPPAKLAASRKQAMDRLNAPRALAALQPLADDAGLAEAAEAHCYYYLFNFGQNQVAGLGVHLEDPQLPGFVASNGLLRARHFGYTGTRGAEVINHVFTAAAAVRVWVDSVYHRFPITDSETAVAGYGEAQVGLISISVVDFGLGAPTHKAAVVYPVDGAKDIPAAFTGNELPNPLPQGARPPAGYPVTLQLGDAASLTVASARLLGPDGKEVAGYSLTPNKEVGPNEWAFLASAPLKPGAVYTADVSGQADGQAFQKRWSFTVLGSSS